MPQDQSSRPAPGGLDAPGPATPPTSANLPKGGRAWIIFVLTLTLAAAGWVLFVNISGFNWAALIAAAANLATLFRASWEFPTRAFLGCFTGLTVLLATFGVGYFLISRRRPWRRMLPLAIERAILAPMVGAVPLSLAVLALGLAGQANAQALGILLILSLYVSMLGVVRFTRDIATQHGGSLGQCLAHKPRLVLFMLILVALLAVPYALSPSVESDELRYHLSAPAAWLQAGRIGYIPYQAFSNFPMLGEMLFMLAMAIGGEEAAKLVHLGFLPVNVGLIALLALQFMGGRRRANPPETAARAQPHVRRRTFLFATGAAFVFIPTVPILAGWGFIDMFMDAAFLAFVYLAGRSLSLPRRASGTLVGVAAAAAIGTKYTMLPLLGGLGALWFMLLLLKRASRPHALRLVCATAALALLLGGPWYLKNYYFTHNPFYPLAWSKFGGGEWSAENARIYADKTLSKGMHLATPGDPKSQARELLLTPYTTMAYFDKFEQHPLGPLPLLALIAGLGGLLASPAWWPGRRRGLARTGPLRRGQATRAWLTLALLGSWVFWFMTYQSNRLLLPTVGLALAAGGWAAWRFEQFAPRWQRLLLRLAYGLGLLFSFLFCFTVLCLPAREGNPAIATKFDALRVALGFESREDYLIRALDYWRGAQWLARHAGPGEKALLVGEHRTMHFTLPVIASDWFDTPQPLPWIRQTPDNDAMLDALKKANVHYIFFNTGLLGKFYRDFFAPRLTLAELDRFQSLWTNPRLKEVYPRDHAGVIIYEIE